MEADATALPTASPSAVTRSDEEEPSPSAETNWQRSSVLASAPSVGRKWAPVSAKRVPPDTGPYRCAMAVAFGSAYRWSATASLLYAAPPSVETRT